MLMASVQEKQTEIAHQAKQLSAIKIENQLMDKKAQELIETNSKLTQNQDKLYQK